MPAGDDESENRSPVPSGSTRRGFLGGLFAAGALYGAHRFGLTKPVEDAAGSATQKVAETAAAAAQAASEIGAAALQTGKEVWEVISPEDKRPPYMALYAAHQRFLEANREPATDVSPFFIQDRDLMGDRFDVTSRLKSQVNERRNGRPLEQNRTELGDQVRVIRIEAPEGPVYRLDFNLELFKSINYTDMNISFLGYKPDGSWALSSSGKYLKPGELASALDAQDPKLTESGVVSIYVFDESNKLLGQRRLDEEKKRDPYWQATMRTFVNGWDLWSEEAKEFLQRGDCGFWISFDNQSGAQFERTYDKYGKPTTWVRYKNTEEVDIILEPGRKQPGENRLNSLTPKAKLY